VAGQPKQRRGIFSFLFTRTKKEELLSEYVIREHHRGRPLTEILADRHVVNSYTPDEINLLLDDPEVIHAVGEDMIAAARSAR
jgi:hypothetical protein